MLEKVVLLLLFCWLTTIFLLLSGSRPPWELTPSPRPLMAIVTSSPPTTQPVVPLALAWTRINDTLKQYGEQGKPVVLPPDVSSHVKALVGEGMQKHAINQYVSDLISLHRSLPDRRRKWCKKPGQFLSDLPKTSVIVCFHNEAWSILLRTVHSILDRSPPHLLHEIVLVDDFSYFPHLKTQLAEYMAMYPKVKIVRATKREGLIRARLLGAKHATGPVLTYLDSHSECAPGWLEPLLDRIARNSTTVVCPIIDVIDDKTLEYKWLKDVHPAVGGFNWNLIFSLHELPMRERRRRKHYSDPVYSPTMAGGYFAIDKEWFLKLGTYDSGFDIWGGENLEISFKTWMCGGTLEYVPCSHVGHISRSRAPYQWLEDESVVVKKNSVRLAEVWMDEYAQNYYERINNDLGEYGDIASRKELRKKLKCKSFRWFVENVYPELYIPGDAVASGEVRNVPSRMCLDAGSSEVLKVWPCHSQGGNQYFMFTQDGHIRSDAQCFQYNPYENDVIMTSCRASDLNQLWIYKHRTGTLMLAHYRKCVAVRGRKKLRIEKCNSTAPQQRWRFQEFNPENAKKVGFLENDEPLQHSSEAGPVPI